MAKFKCEKCGKEEEAEAASECCGGPMGEVKAEEAAETKEPEAAQPETTETAEATETKEPEKTE